MSGIVGVDKNGAIHHDFANPGLTPLFRIWIVGLSRSGRTGLNKAFLTDGKSAWGIEMQTPSRLWARNITKEAAVTLATPQVKHPFFRLADLRDPGSPMELPLDILRLDKDKINNCIKEFLNGT